MKKHLANTVVPLHTTSHKMKSSYLCTQLCSFVWLLLAFFVALSFHMHFSTHYAELTLYNFCMISKSIPIAVLFFWNIAFSSICPLADSIQCPNGLISNIRDGHLELNDFADHRPRAIFIVTVCVKDVADWLYLFFLSTYHKQNILE